jgi:hypothetical protein
VVVLSPVHRRLPGRLCRHPCARAEVQLTAGDGIRCPVCDSTTGVSNTQQGRGHIRRFRRCHDRECPGRLWTVERPEAAPPPDQVMVPRRLLKQLRELARKLYSPTAARETACASPEGDDIPVIE